GEYPRGIPNNYDIRNSVLEEWRQAVSRGVPLDLPQIGRVASSTSVDFEVRSSMQSGLVVYEAFDGGQIVGTLTIEMDPSHGPTVEALVVHPQHRRRGIGSQLIKSALDDLGSLHPGTAVTADGRALMDAF